MFSTYELRIWRWANSGLGDENALKRRRCQYINTTLITSNNFIIPTSSFFIFSSHYKSPSFKYASRTFFSTLLCNYNFFQTKQNNFNFQSLQQQTTNLSK